MKKGFIYSLPELAINGIETFIRLYLIIFYTQKQNLDPKLAGLAIGLATFWDAITDPIVGAWSDRFQQTRGKRDSLFVLGGLFTALLLFTLFYPKEFSSQALLFWFLLVGMILFSTATTFLVVPYSALIGDLKLTAAERGQFVGWRLGMANFGALLGLSIPGYLILKNPEGFYFESALILSILVMSLVSIVYFVVREWPRENNSPSAASLFFDWRTQTKSFRIKGFFNLVCAFFVANVGLTLNSSLALLYYRNWLKLPETQIQAVLIIFFIVFSVSIPFWLLISRSRSKLNIGAWGIMALGVSNCLIYLIIPPENFLMTVLGASLVGGVLVASYVLLESYLIDIIKANDERENKNTFGFTYGIWKMSGKVSRGIALFLTGLILSNVMNQTTKEVINETALAYYFGPGVGIFFIAAAFIVLRARP